jgi:hypothetical protein
MFIRIRINYCEGKLAIELTVQKPNELVISHRGSYFDSNWVADTLKVLDMGTIQLTSAVADPDEMCRSIVVAFGSCDGVIHGRRARLAYRWGSAKAAISIHIGRATSRWRDRQPPRERLLVVQYEALMTGVEVDFAENTPSTTAFI